MFSWKVLVDSLVTLRDNFLLYRQTDDNSNNNKHLSKTNLKIFVQSNRYHSFLLSKAEIDYFKDIVNFCRQNNIELKVFISPVHAVQSEMIYRLGLSSDFIQTKMGVTSSYRTLYW